MNAELIVYNTLSRKKEVFKPITEGHVGMYLCGPTVYGDGHLGHARPAITFDLIYRYLRHLGLKVRYVRNITDVGHLEDEVAGEGEDKIQKKARLEKLEPMEIAQYYTDRYHEDIDRLNVLRPGIEPRASGHIIEQISIIEQILKNGFAYIVDGSVYFDVIKFSQKHEYGQLSGRVLDDLLSGTRDLDGQDEKRNSADFALWKKAKPEHIMRWPSPWGEGFPGWHIECSAMSTKYLGETFDIHGGGMDLLFPHHECEIAQCEASTGKAPANYWIHNNMLTINGQKMGKSLGNFITLKEFYSGNHLLLKQAYSPMTIRFFLLQAHYRGTVDFSNEALIAAEKAYRKIINGLRSLDGLRQNDTPSVAEDPNLNNEITNACNLCSEGMNDDFNSAITISALFQILKNINSFKSGIQHPDAISKDVFKTMLDTYRTFVVEILGLQEELAPNNPEFSKELLAIILASYTEAKNRKDYASVDAIRAELKKSGIVIRDSKTGSEWATEE
jgi:cysteinyl-tRNA synthetase